MSDIDLGLGNLLGGDGAEAASNSVNAAAAAETVERHNFRADQMPSAPYPPPPFFPQTAVPATAPALFGVPKDGAPDQRVLGDLQRQWSEYSERLAKLEAERGAALGFATARERYDQELSNHRLAVHQAQLDAQYARAHPPTAAGALGQAVVPWVPTLFHDPLFRLVLQLGLFAGVGYLFWALGQRLLPKEMREK